MFKLLSKIATFATAFISTFTLQRLIGIFPNSYILRGIISAILSIIIYKQIFRYRGHKRRLSTFSVSMCNAFAKECQAPPTIINGWIYFNELPSVESHLQLLMDKLITQYYRFHSYVDTDPNGYLVWTPTETTLTTSHATTTLPQLNPAKEKFFIHYAQNDQEVHQIATRIAATPFQHECNVNIALNTTKAAKSSPWEIHQIVNIGLLPNKDKNDYGVSLLDPSHIDPPLRINDNYTQTTLPAEQQPKATITQANPTHLPSTHHTLIFRIDHAVGDGISLMNVFGKLTTDEKGIEIGTKLFTAPEKNTDNANGKGKTTTTPVKSTKPSKNIISKTFAILKTIFNVLTLATGPFDTPSSYNQVQHCLNKFQHTREIVVSPTIHLDNVKNLKNVAQCTVNDILFCATSGALRRLAVHNEKLKINSNHTPSQLLKQQTTTTHPIFSTSNNNKNIDNVTCRALLPIAFPRPYEQLQNPVTALSNRFTFVSANMFIHITDIKERLKAIVEMTSDLKSGPAAPVSFALTSLGTTLLPASVCQDTAAQLFSRHSVVFSNVPGPTGTVLYAGKQIVGLQMVYPNIITQMGIVSLNNHIFLNFTLDPIEMPNSNLLGQFVLDELIDMAKLFNVNWIQPFNQP